MHSCTPRSSASSLEVIGSNNQTQLLPVPPIPSATTLHFRPFFESMLQRPFHAPPLLPLPSLTPSTPPYLLPSTPLHPPLLPLRSIGSTLQGVLAHKGSLVRVVYDASRFDAELSSMDSALVFFADPTSRLSRRADSAAHEVAEMLRRSGCGECGDGGGSGGGGCGGCDG
jgi:hypothetical protein